jgi:hypothetical protein
LVLPPRIGDNNVKAAQRRHSPGNELVTELLAAKIAGNPNALATCCLDESNDFAGIGLFRRQVIDGDVRAFASICNRSGATHTGITTSDERLSPSEAARSLVTLHCRRTGRSSCAKSGDQITPRQRIVIIHSVELLVKP